MLTLPDGRHRYMIISYFRIPKMEGGGVCVVVGGSATYLVPGKKLKAKQTNKNPVRETEPRLEGAQRRVVPSGRFST